jgi:hypothetical protein
MRQMRVTGDELGVFFLSENPGCMGSYDPDGSDMGRGSAPSASRFTTVQELVDYIRLVDSRDADARWLRWARGIASRVWKRRCPARGRFEAEIKREETTVC